MPADTATPCSTKFTLLPLVELARDQLLQRCERSFGVHPVGLDGDGGAFARGEHHHAHDALRVDAAAVARQPELALVAARDLGQLGRGPRVQAELVDDLYLSARHHGAPGSLPQESLVMCTTPSVPPESAFSTTTTSPWS